MIKDSKQFSVNDGDAETFNLLKYLEMRYNMLTVTWIIYVVRDETKAYR